MLKLINYYSGEYDNKSDGTLCILGETVQGNYNKNENYERKVNADETYGIMKATITIYEGKIVKGFKNGSWIINEGLTIEQATGVVAVHECINATDNAEINIELKLK